MGGPDPADGPPARIVREASWAGDPAGELRESGGPPRDAEAAAMTASACAVLALAVLCAPGGGAGRVRMLWPEPGQERAARSATRALPVVAAGAAGLVLAGPGGALAAVLAAVVVRRGRARRREVAEAAAATGELAEALRRMTDELRTGAHPAAALGGVAADGARARALLTPAATAARLGDAVPGALARAAGSSPLVAADLHRLAGAWALADRHGVPLADLLAGTHTDLRWRVRFAAQVHAQLAGPRATAAVLSALPLLGLAFGQLVGADPVGVLRGGVLGQVLLVVGAVLVAAGATWSEHILRSAVPR